MKPPPFEYHAPSTVDEACALLASLEDAKVLAGGQSLMPLLNFRLARPAHLVDINRIAGLDRIYERDGGVAVQALARQAAVEDSELVARVCPLLSAAVRLVAHRVIRNRGTVCGSIAHADPASELPAVLLVLGGHVVARSKRGDRKIEASELFAGVFETSIAPDDALTFVVIVDESEHPVVLLLGERVVLMVVALGALNGQPEHRFADGIHPIALGSRVRFPSNARVSILCWLSFPMTRCNSSRETANAKWHGVKTPFSRP